MGIDEHREKLDFYSFFDQDSHLIPAALQSMLITSYTQMGNLPYSK